MKKKIRILTVILIVAVMAGGLLWFFKFREGKGGGKTSDEAVFVSSVAEITGVGLGGSHTRFAGVTEPQRTVNIEVASGMKVKDTFVTEGQEVSVGTRLFSYDTEEAQDNIAQLEIDVENYDITIESTQNQITQLKKERDKVSEDEKLAYTTQIMTAENSVKRSEYEKKSKQVELESLKRQVANSVVTSESKGVVKSVNKNGDSSSMDMIDTYDGSSDSNAYITIMETGDYRIKGMVNEMNAQQLTEGTAVLVHSRVDENQVWRGTVSEIDRENATVNQNSMMMGNGDSSMTSSSSYPFYIDLEDSAGLMLGQHVFIEPDNGQMEERSGLWLDDYYLILDEEGQFSNYVWAADENDRLEKRELTLGEYDPDMMQYEIKEGLTIEDYIAFPADGYEEGMEVTRNIAQAGQMNMGDDGVYEEEMDMGDDGVYEEEMNMGDDGVYEEEMDMGGEVYDESMAEDFFEEEAGFDEEIQVFEE